MIYKYLLEIKYRIFFCFLTWGFMVVNCYCFKETLLYVFMTFSLKSKNTDFSHFLTTDVAEVFFAYIHISSHVANQVTIMFLCCQFFLFLSAGLHIFEYDYLKTILLTTTVCWLIFIFVLNYLIFPTSWHFFLKFQEYVSSQNLAVFFEAKLNEYLIFYKSIYYLCNLIYQIIVILFILLDLFRTNLLIIKRLRKIFYFLFFILSTFLTPPEVVYQLAIGICIIMIYELSTIYLILRTELVNFR